MGVQTKIQSAFWKITNTKTCQMTLFNASLTVGAQCFQFNYFLFNILQPIWGNFFLPYCTQRTSIPIQICGGVCVNTNQTPDIVGQEQNFQESPFRQITTTMQSLYSGTLHFPQINFYNYSNHSGQTQSPLSLQDLDTGTSC